ncbi:MAG TPA: hypothetical protein VFO34_04800 [Candidatus Acidoferrales bacterium]|nr:hypothetical protein [Candidatus Acidoferrales bacterium]
MTALTGWENFYVIVGSSAGALIGLQFVVMALIANLPFARPQAAAAEAFATPTIVHFSSILIIAATLCAPWRSLSGPAILLAMFGAGGIVYEITVIRRMRSQSIYSPELEDWIFHALLPCTAYAAIAASACFIPAHARKTLFAVGAAALLLMIAGIHNAWDAVTYHIYFMRRSHTNIDQSQEQTLDQS